MPGAAPLPLPAPCTLGGVDAAHQQPPRRHQETPIPAGVHDAEAAIDDAPAPDAEGAHYATARRPAVDAERFSAGQWRSASRHRSRRSRTYATGRCQALATSSSVRIEFPRR